MSADTDFMMAGFGNDTLTDRADLMCRVRQRTDAERLAWLVQRVTYLEHNDAQGNHCLQQDVGGWWPQTEDDVSPTHEDCIDLDLIAYVDRMIAKEST